MKFDGNTIPAERLKASPVLLIPSGGLYGKENDQSLQLILAEDVRLGGNLVVLSQQAGSREICL